MARNSPRAFCDDNGRVKCRRTHSSDCFELYLNGEEAEDIEVIDIVINQQGAASKLRQLPLLGTFTHSLEDVRNMECSIAISFFEV